MFGVVSTHSQTNYMNTHSVYNCTCILICMTNPACVCTVHLLQKQCTHDITVLLQQLSNLRCTCTLYMYVNVCLYALTRYVGFVHIYMYTVAFVTSKLFKVEVGDDKTWEQTFNYHSHTMSQLHVIGGNSCREIELGGALVTRLYIILQRGASMCALLCIVILSHHRSVDFMLVLNYSSCVVLKRHLGYSVAT